MSSVYYHKRLSFIIFEVICERKNEVSYVDVGAEFFCCIHATDRIHFVNSRVSLQPFALILAACVDIYLFESDDKN